MAMIWQSLSWNRCTLTENQRVQCSSRFGVWEATKTAKNNNLHAYGKAQDRICAGPYQHTQVEHAALLIWRFVSSPYLPSLQRTVAQRTIAANAVFLAHGFAVRQYRSNRVTCVTSFFGLRGQGNAFRVSFDGCL